MNKTLIRLVAETIAFLELSDDEAIDPDAAVRELESIGLQLQELSSDERDEFFAFVTDTLVPEAEASGQQERADLFGDLRSNLGI